MPTKKEREYYRMGYTDGYNHSMRGMRMQPDRDYDRRTIPAMIGLGMETEYAFRESQPKRRRRPQKPKKKRTLSAWQKFMKSPKSQIKYKSGKDKGKLNLRAMGRAYRKKQKGKK